jgi:hypothetical protein
MDKVQKIAFTDYESIQHIKQQLFSPHLQTAKMFSELFKFSCTFPSWNNVHKS